MSGTVGVIADVAGRYTTFTQCLTALITPPNTQCDFALGSDRGVGRNRLVERSIERGSEWLLFLDDDMWFPPTLLNRLLSHNQPVVTGLYLQRAAPFMPIAFAERDANGDYWPLDLANHTDNELVRIVGAGAGGMLVRSEVFHQINPPWFVHTTVQSEDNHFCALLVDHDIPLYVDTGSPLGHVAPAVVTPRFHEGEWCAAINYSHSGVVLLPAVRPDRV